MTAEENYRLLQEMDANRRFLLLALRSNPALLAQAEPRVRLWLGVPENQTEGQDTVRRPQDDE